MSAADKRKAKKVDCKTVCPEWGCSQPSEHDGIWIIGEMGEGGITEPSLQMLTPARVIARKLGTFVEGILMGDERGPLEEAAEEMIRRGADRVTVIYGDEFSDYIPAVRAAAAAKLAEERKPDVIFLAATMRGREIAPYLAALSRAGITADCTQFDVDEETGDLLMIRPPFAAILLAYIKTPTRRPQIATARPNIFPMPPADPNRRGEVTWKDAADYCGKRPPMRLLKREQFRRDEMPVEKAERIVAGGKGIGTKEGFRSLEELAELLGGVVAGSRRAVDLGLVPHEKQIGQTGKSVRPKLYIAVGISGAAQHVIGIREAGTVVAINNDPEAPIFKSADYGIVADWREVLPLLIEELRGQSRPAGRDGDRGGSEG